MKFFKKSAAWSPIAFAAKNARFVSKYPDGPDELWVADLKACRRGHLLEIFEDILFVESNGTTFICGIEFEDGCPSGLDPTFARKQQSFIQFLRDELRQDIEAAGPIAGIFAGTEYATVGKATAAYIAARGVPLMMGVGYRDGEDKYQLVTIDPEEGSWLKVARHTIPFDELGQPG